MWGNINMVKSKSSAPERVKDKADGKKDTIVRAQPDSASHSAPIQLICKECGRIFTEKLFK